MQLGLDLKGGMQLTLQLDTADFLKDLAGEGAKDKLNKALAVADRKAGISQEEYLDVFFDAYEQLETPTAALTRNNGFPRTSS